MGHRKNRGQRGDTIVEVLIAIAVISLVLVGAYASVNHNALTMQDSQEHGQALKLLQSQLEFLRNNGGISGGSCFSSAGLPTGSCNFNSAGTAPTGNQTPYTMNITGPDGTKTYTVKVTWPSVLASSGTGQITMFYRPGGV